MKEKIHPNYDKAKIICACGNVIETRSTVKEMHINTCSACHPFFTGQAAFIDSEGRVEQFRKRYANKPVQAKKPEPKRPEPKKADIRKPVAKKVEARKPEPRKPDAPKTEAPKVEAPKVEAPKTETPKQAN